MLSNHWLLCSPNLVFPAWTAFERGYDSFRVSKPLFTIAVLIAAVAILEVTKITFLVLFVVKLVMRRMGKLPARSIRIPR